MFQTTIKSELDLIPALKNISTFQVEKSGVKVDSSKQIVSSESKKVFSKFGALKSIQSDIIKLINLYKEERNKTAYLFLDDFYQVKNDHQPKVFNYLHEISKETVTGAFAFNTCLVPNRFKLNYEGERVLSRRDDFSTLNLDRDFDSLDENKTILLKILCGLDKELKLNTRLINKLFNDSNVLNNIVFASGALPRVFLDVFSLMVRFSKAENERKIHNKVFPEAINQLRKEKEELIEEEAELSTRSIKQLLSRIEDEVVKSGKTNLIHYPKVDFDKHEQILVTLFNLGYLHRIKEEEKNEKGLFVPVMLDMTFTHGEKRFPAGFKLIRFWDKRKYKSNECYIWSFNDGLVEAILKRDLNN